LSDVDVELYSAIRRARDPFLIRQIRENTLKQRLSSLALRKTRHHFQSKFVMPVLICAILVIGLSGPFGTFETLPLILRIGYWAFIVVFTYTTAIFVVSFAGLLLPTSWPEMLIDGVSGALAGPFVTAVVYAINTMTFTQSNAAISAPPTFSLLIYCTAIAIAVSILIGLFQGSIHIEQGSRSATPLLIDRLPFDKRAPLVSLQAQDHYVRVATTKGSELLLMRIADAINEVGDTIGFQTHRSYWVAQDQISKSKQLGECGMLILQDGSEIPVSRKYLQDLKSRGFF